MSKTQRLRSHEDKPKSDVDLIQPLLYEATIYGRCPSKKCPN